MEKEKLPGDNEEFETDDVIKYEAPAKAEEDIVEDVRTRKLVLHRRDVIKASNLIGEYAKILREKYADFEDYRLYHVLAGSSPKGECAKFDFPGEDSVQKFMEKTFDEFNKV